MLESLTRQKIRSLADNATIYNRGVDYFKNRAVDQIWLEEIQEQSGQIIGNCNCLYEGQYCKHIVAVGLTFLDQKEKLLKKAKQADNQNAKTLASLLLLSKRELADLLILSLKTHQDWRDVLYKALGEKLAGYGDSGKVQNIYAQQFNHSFKRICKILREHNQYGGGPEEEEDELYDRLQTIEEFFKSGRGNQRLRREFIDKMFYYYDWDNSGLNDLIIDAIFAIADSDDDWRYIIEKLKVYKDEWREEMIIEIYRNHLKDEESYLKLRKKS